MTGHVVGNTRVPLLHVQGRVLVSIQDALTDSQVDRLRDDLGDTLARRGARGLVIDVTGVDVLDSFVTRSIRDMALVARFMGVPTVVCGLQPGVAMTLVDMGMDLGGVRTTLNMDQALGLLGSQEGGA